MMASSGISRESAEMQKAMSAAAGPVTLSGQGTKSFDRELRVTSPRMGKALLLLRVSPGGCAGAIYKENVSGLHYISKVTRLRDWNLATIERREKELVKFAREHWWG
jgi:hypothetical protein